MACSSHIHFCSSIWAMRIPVLCCVHLHPLLSPPHFIHGAAAVLFWSAAVLLIFSFSQHQLSCLGLMGFCMYFPAVAQSVNGAWGEQDLSGTALLFVYSMAEFCINYSLLAPSSCRVVFFSTLRPISPVVPSSFCSVEVFGSTERSTCKDRLG